MSTQSDKFLDMQRSVYSDLAGYWTVHDRDPLVGCFDEHEEWEDYKHLFMGLFDFHGDAKYLPKARNSVVLDFGCGPARNIFKYGQHFKRVDGVDISPEVIEKAKEWLTDRGAWNNNKLFVCSGRDLDCIDDEQYDAVMSTITLQHICVHEIRLNLLKEFFRVIKAGGWFTGQMGFGSGKEGSVPYDANYYEAPATNGWHDTRVESPEELRLDLQSVGFHKFDYVITPAGPCDNHPNWIFFRGRKLWNR